MFKMIFALSLLTVMIGCIIMAAREADSKSRKNVLKFLGFTAICASAAFVVLSVIVILF